MTNRKTVEVSVLDINDNYPLFCNEGKCSKEVQTLYRPIVEKSPIDSVVALPVAVDKDIGNNGTVHYSLTGAKNKIQFFEINNATGLVTLKLPVDINKLVDLNIISANETDNATLEVSIVATDNGTPQQQSNTLALIVTVEKINDDAPVFSSPLYSFQVPENSAIGKNVLLCLYQ